MKRLDEMRPRTLKLDVRIPIPVENVWALEAILADSSATGDPPSKPDKVRTDYAQMVREGIADALGSDGPERERLLDIDEPLAPGLYAQVRNADKEDASLHLVCEGGALSTTAEIAGVVVQEMLRFADCRETVAFTWGWENEGGAVFVAQDAVIMSDPNAWIAGVATAYELGGPQAAAEWEGAGAARREPEPEEGAPEPG